jgi:hypothetical protein
MIDEMLLHPYVSTKRIVLNKQFAAEIYSHKLALMTPTSFKECLQVSQLKGRSTKVALQYGVSAKTIRDIWNRKTWTDATFHLWKDELRQVND